MKIYISADIEGVAGIAAPSEANILVPGEYEPYRQQMAAEVQAACVGAYSAGASAILVKDAHGTGRNLVLADFQVPDGRSFELIRGWSGHPLGMVQDIDESYAGALFVGFHAAAGQSGNPLSHTINGRLFARVELNGETASELRLYALAAATVGVPILFVSGDCATCDEAEAMIPGVTAVRTLSGEGHSVRSIAPRAAVQQIEAGVHQALAGKRTSPLELCGPYTLRVEFRHGADAYARSFYPGARLVSPIEIQLESDDYLDILTFLRFASKYA